jgi:hypothetical protein
MKQNVLSSQDCLALNEVHLPCYHQGVSDDLHNEQAKHE